MMHQLDLKAEGRNKQEIENAFYHQLRLYLGSDSRNTPEECRKILSDEVWVAVELENSTHAGSGEMVDATFTATLRICV